MKYIGIEFDSAREEYSVRTANSISTIIIETKASIERDEALPRWFQVEIDDDGNPSLEPIEVLESGRQTIQAPKDEVPLTVGGTRVGEILVERGQTLPKRATRREYQQRMEEIRLREEAQRQPAPTPEPDLTRT